MAAYKIIDTPWHTTSQIQCLKNEGIQTVIRYYNNGNSNQLPEKRLELDEALALANGGLDIMVIWQISNNEVSDFTFEKGYSDSQNAYKWARETIRQPSGSAIYFAVDYDASQSDLKSSIIPYFEGIKKVFGDLSDPNTNFKVGAYGSGLIVNALKNQKLCEYRWLSESLGYHGTKEALYNGAYELYQKYTSLSNICGIAVDFDVQNPEVSDIGSFNLSQNIVAT